MKMKSGAPPYLRVVKDVEARKKVLMLLIKRFKSWWMPLCGKININARQFVKTCAQCQCGNTRFDKVATKLHPIPIPSKVWYQIGVDLCSLPHTDEGFALCKKGCYTRLYNIVIRVVIQYLLYTLRIIVYNCV